ncbi:metal-dependent transcriptional regulator [Sunxiuqinia elliptica]
MTLKTKENYLKAMYMLAEEEGVISLSGLGKRLGVSKPTVNSMVKQFQHEGWVEYQKYKPIELTSQGKKEAALVIRRHRLVEMFLVEKMEFGWEEVHDIAEEMEHVEAEVLFDRMNDMLGNPAFDPHGSPIPDKNGNVLSRPYLSLSEMRRGDRVVVKALRDDNKEFLDYLNGRHIRLEVEMLVEQIETFDKSMTISIEKEPSLNLSKEVCDRLLVERL